MVVIYTYIYTVVVIYTYTYTVVVIYTYIYTVVVIYTYIYCGSSLLLRDEIKDVAPKISLFLSLENPSMKIGRCINFR